MVIGMITDEVVCVSEMDCMERKKCTHLLSNTKSKTKSGSGAGNDDYSLYCSLDSSWH